MGKYSLLLTMIKSSIDLEEETGDSRYRYVVLGVSETPDELERGLNKVRSELHKSDRYIEVDDGMFISEENMAEMITVSINKTANPDQVMDLIHDWALDDSESKIFA